MNSSIVLNAAAGSSYGLILSMVIRFVFMYFVMIRPQNKEQKAKQAMLSSLSVGDTVLTTSGFYGVIIAIPDDTTVIVEFGCNKNCRISMQKASIAQVEKPEDAVKAKTEEKSK